MGCRSDYLEPTNYEVEVRETATLLLWFLQQLDRRDITVIAKTKAISGNTYPTKADGDFVVSTLCGELRELQTKTKAKFDEIVYGRNKRSRELANWWEDHQKADNIRIKKDFDRRSKEWTKIAELLYVGDSEMDGHLDYFINTLLELGYEIPKLSKNKD